MSAKPAIRNKTWAELKVGDTASLERRCSVQDLILFAHVSGNVNLLMLPSAEGSPEKTEPVAPSMWVGSLVSAVLGNLLPGPGTLYALNVGRLFVTLKPRGQRMASADQIIARLGPQLDKVEGAKLFMQVAQDLTVGGRASRTQFQYTL